MDEFLGVAEAAGYAVSGFKDPYSTIVLRKLCDKKQSEST